MGLSLALHLITAYFSVGHLFADEYFQILEFASAKLGNTPLESLTVEFHEKMRPWLQPYLYWILAKGWLIAGVSNPFTWALSFRMMTGLVGWASLVFIGRCVPIWFKDPRAQRFCIQASALLWFLPALQSRPSSESLGGTFFLLSTAVFCLLSQVPQAHSALKPTWNQPLWKWIGCGFLLGMSFNFRYQMAAMIGGLGLWAIVASNARKKFAITSTLGAREFSSIAGGLIVATGLGIILDYIGYGQWVLTPWRYFNYNLIRGEMNRFGQAPWWDFFRMSMTEAWPFIGFALLITSIVAWLRHPRHPLTWAGVPFYLLHSVIAHKELRFLFPLAMHGPILSHPLKALILSTLSSTQRPILSTLSSSQRFIL